MSEMHCSIIVTCKGRLDHLKRTLPAMLAQKGVEVVVVDYDCPDGTEEWVNKTYPNARTIKVEAAPMFHGAHARNVGAQAATGNWLFFVDADILMNENLLNGIGPMLSPDCFYRPSPATEQTWGSVMLARKDFDRIGGYDQVIKGYGTEDDDLYLRLKLIGICQMRYESSWLTEIAHADDLRSRFYEVKDLNLSQRANSLYVAAKIDLMRLLGRNLTHDERQSIFEQARHAVAIAGDTAPGILEISFPVENAIPVQEGWSLQRSLTLSLSPLPRQDIVSGG